MHILTPGTAASTRSACVGWRCDTHLFDARTATCRPIVAACRCLIERFSLRVAAMGVRGVKNSACPCTSLCEFVSFHTDVHSVRTPSTLNAASTVKERRPCSSWTRMDASSARPHSSHPTVTLNLTSQSHVTPTSPPTPNGSPLPPPFASLLAFARARWCKVFRRQPPSLPRPHPPGSARGSVFLWWVGWRWRWR